MVLPNGHLNLEDTSLLLELERGSYLQALNSKNPDSDLSAVIAMITKAKRLNLVGSLSNQTLENIYAGAEKSLREKGYL